MAKVTIEQAVLAALVKKAIMRQTTNYEELAAEVGLPTEWPQLGAQLSPVLYSIFYWCETKRLPKLTSLVVRKSGADMGLPGAGFWDVAKLPNLTRNERVTLTDMFKNDCFDFFEVQ